MPGAFVSDSIIFSPFLLNSSIADRWTPKEKPDLLRTKIIVVEER